MPHLVTKWCQTVWLGMLCNKRPRCCHNFVSECRPRSQALSSLPSLGRWKTTWGRQRKESLGMRLGEGLFIKQKGLWRVLWLGQSENSQNKVLLQVTQLLLSILLTYLKTLLGCFSSFKIRTTWPNYWITLLSELFLSFISSVEI